MGAIPAGCFETEKLKNAQQVITGGGGKMLDQPTARSLVAEGGGPKNVEDEKPRGFGQGGAPGI